MTEVNTTDKFISETSPNGWKNRTLNPNYTAPVKPAKNPYPKQISTRTTDPYSGWKNTTWAPNPQYDAWEAKNGPVSDSDRNHPGDGGHPTSGPLSGSRQIPTGSSPGMNLGGAVSNYLGANPDAVPKSDPEDDAREDPNQVSYNNEYVAKFNASMGAQRAAIDNALTTALASLGARRDAASKVVAGIPQQIKDTYNATDTKQSSIMSAADKAIGPRGAPGGNANAALYASDNSMAKKSGLAVQPLLEAGVQSNYDIGESGLNQTHLEGITQLNSQQAGFDASMAQGEQARNYQLEDRQWAIDHPEADPSNRITADQAADNQFQKDQAKEEKRRWDVGVESEQEAAARGEGYSSHAGRQKGESLARFFTRPSKGKLDAKTLGTYYDSDTLLALKNFKAITDAEYAEATGQSVPKG